MKRSLSGIGDALELGDRVTAVLLVREAVQAGQPAAAILEAMTAAMAHVGDRFAQGEIFVPEMLVAARAMKESMVALEPALGEAGIRPDVTAVIGSVRGDLHDIGKNLVGMMWKGAGIEVVDLGTNVEPAQFVAAACDRGARLVGVSALLTTTMIEMRQVVAAIREADLPDTRVIVGGAPVTPAFAAEIGADGYAPDAGSAVQLANSLLGRTGRGRLAVAPSASEATG
jgi:5-methyltetrahydrofolate--homocysteine methyltransferase